MDFARCVDGVDVGVLIEQRPEGGVKASLRAKDPLCRLDLVAGQFAGGGHACAAGLNLSPAPADFRARLLAALALRLKEMDAAPPPPAGQTAPRRRSGWSGRSDRIRAGRARAPGAARS